jgi:hypothetical protein
VHSLCLLKPHALAGIKPGSYVPEVCRCDDHCDTTQQRNMFYDYGIILPKNWLYGLTLLKYYRRKNHQKFSFQGNFIFCIKLMKSRQK